MRALRGIVCIVCVIGLLTPATPAAANPAGCAPDSAGGDWPSYGGALDNARNQRAETQIGPAEAANLEPLWVQSGPDLAPNGGGFSNTPVVADGCVYLASNTGWVIALDADEGDLVWRTRLDGSGQTLLGGVIVGSPAVGNGLVYVGVSRPGSPYVAALDQTNGDVVWTTTVDDIDNSLINASPVLFDGMLFQGFAGNESTDVARGGYAILDASREGGGTILEKRYTIPQEDYDRGYRGASVWCTASVDIVNNYVYACGGNPASKRLEHRHSNALFKIDADPTRETFGDIVDAFKGNPDQYYPGLERQPVCDMFSDDLVYAAWSAACLQLDLDFGASPNLFTDDAGRLLLGALQKSGIYYAVWADNMQLAWSTVIGAPCVPCNAASTAFDDEKIYAVGTPVGQMVAFTKNSGRYRWAAPIADGIHFHSTTVTNGVVYTVDGYGFLDAFDAETGAPILHRPITLDAGELVTDAGNSSGVSIARNTVFVAASQYIVAYQPT